MEVVRLVVMLGAVLKAESVGVAAAVAPQRGVWVAAAAIVRVEQQACSLGSREAALWKVVTKALALEAKVVVEAQQGGR